MRRERKRQKITKDKNVTVCELVTLAKWPKKKKFTKKKMLMRKSIWFSQVFKDVQVELVYYGNGHNLPVLYVENSTN